MTGSTRRRTFSRFLTSATLFSLVCLFMPLQGSAQTGLAQLTVYSSPIVYSNPAYDSMAVVEFPFVMNRAELEFFRPDSSDSAYYSRVFAQVVLLRDGTTPSDSNNTYFSVKVADLNEALVPDFHLFNKLALKVRPGVYTAHLTVIDVASKRSKDIYFGKFEAAAPISNRMNISRPALAYSIRYVGDTGSAADDRMNQNGYRVLNNPLGIYGTRDSVAYLYAEVYGLAYGAGHEKTFNFATALVDSAGSPVRNFGFKMIPKPGRSAVVTQALDLASIDAGRYSLRVIASDSSAHQADTEAVPLIIIAPPAPLFGGGISTDPWDSLSLDQKAQATYWFLNPEQRTVLGRLNDAGKLNFLIQFWRENSLKDSEHPMNNRTETARRFQYANAHYSRDGLKGNGWSSDRGRIYIIYGPWDTHTDVATPRNGNPYLVWRYNTYNEGKLFVFVDTRGDGDYRLVHSNVHGEPYSSTWEALLQNGIEEDN